MSWVYLLLAGFFEMAFTTSLKMSDNFSMYRWVAAFFVSILLSFFFLNKAIQAIPIGTAYAVWTGIGGAGTVVINILFFDEPFSLLKLSFLFLLIVSIIGLKLVAK